MSAEKKYAIKNSLSQKEMEEVEKRFTEGKNPTLTLADIFERSKRAKLAKLE